MPVMRTVNLREDEVILKVSVQTGLHIYCVSLSELSLFKD